MNNDTLLNKVGLLIVGLWLTVNGYSQSFLTNGLVAYYPFNGNGNEAVDGYNLTNSVISFADDRFNAPNSAVVLSRAMWATNLIYAESSAPRTLSEWVKVKDYPGNTGGTWLCKPNANYAMLFQSTVMGNGLASDGEFWLDTSLNGVAFFQIPLPTNWSHIVIVYSGGIDTAQVYFNGQLVPLKRTFDQGPGFAYPSQQYPVLALPDGPGLMGFSTNNFIDDVRIYNRALSALEVQQLYQYESHPPCIPHVAKATAQLVNGFVVGATITGGGCGYTNAPLVLITGGGGSGATATAIINDGIVTDITITSTGIGYTNAPRVQVASPPFMPWLEIGVKTVKVTQHVVLGKYYVLESSTDLNIWSQIGVPFTAQEEVITQEYDVDVVGRYFRIRQIP